MTMQHRDDQRDEHRRQVEDRLRAAAGRACTSVHGAARPARPGICMPRKSCRKLTRWPDQPTATVAAPSAYSRIRSQPMIHAKNSPSVA